MQSSISLCHLPWWAVLASWLLPAVLGYFWGMLQWSRYYTKNKKTEQELSSASRRIVNLEKEVNECRQAYDKVNKEKEKILLQKGTEPITVAPNMPKPIAVAPQEIIHETKNIFGYAIRRNDFKIIDGVDPKVEKILLDAGIPDWNSLEMADVTYLNSLLKEFNRTDLNPQSWPYQASLARQGKWEELRDFQKNK